MSDSRRIAGLLGPVIVAVTVSEAINPDIWAVATPPVVYLTGAFLFVVGLAIVRVHNRWERGWPVLVTAVGWVSVAGGLVRMFAPEFAQRQGQNANAVLAFLLSLLAVGIVLTYRGYRRDEG